MRDSGARRCTESDGDGFMYHRCAGVAASREIAMVNFKTKNFKVCVLAFALLGTIGVAGQATAGQSHRAG